MIMVSSYGLLLVMGAFTLLIGILIQMVVMDRARGRAPEDHIVVLHMGVQTGIAEDVDAPRFRMATKSFGAGDRRTVSTQAQVTYRRKKATPRFEVLRPGEDGAWSD